MWRSTPQGRCVNLYYSSSKAPHFNHTKTQSPFKSYIVGSSGSLTSSPMSFPMVHCAPVTLSFLAAPKLHQIASYFRTLAFVLFSAYNVLPQKILMDDPLPISQVIGHQAFTDSIVSSCLKLHPFGVHLS